jgi:hypothetical protein
MNKERRSHERVVIEMTVNCIKYQTQTMKKEYSLAYTKNLSAQGTHLVVSTVNKIGDYLSIGLLIPTFFIPTNICGEVVWMKTTPKNAQARVNTYEIGIKFVGVEMWDAERIQKFLDHRSYEIKQLLTG